MEKFNQKLSIWLDDSRFIFENSDIQERLFELIDFDETPSITDEEYELIKTMVRRMIKLSFIVKNHKEELTKTINYLSSK